jgi:hypothetical protein
MVHFIYRTIRSLFSPQPEKQIAQEVWVCGDCKQSLDKGACPMELQLLHEGLIPEELPPVPVIPSVPPVRQMVAGGTRVVPSAPPKLLGVALPSRVPTSLSEKPKRRKDGARGKRVE